MDLSALTNIILVQKVTQSHEIWHIEEWSQRNVHILGPKIIIAVDPLGSARSSLLKDYLGGPPNVL